MTLASHNTMTYLKGTFWNPFQFIARCQSKTIEEQYKLGVRYFDLRIAYDKYGHAHFKHGLMTYKGSVYDTLKYLNSLEEIVFVHLLLEVKSKKQLERQSQYFIEDCKEFESIFKNISFTSGQNKYNWETLYKFNPLPHSLAENYSSMPEVKNKLWSLWPWLYAKLHCKKHIDCPDFLMVDFVQLWT